MHHRATHLVKIEFQRVQKFLFSVPRLKTIVGANVALGETIRRGLSEIAEKRSCPLPEDLVRDFPLIGDDPLNRTADEQDKDNPPALFCKGILRRDGGHFAAVFASVEDAGAFKKEAEELLLKELPGLRFDIEVEEIGQRRAPSAAVARYESLLDLPVFQVCQESGNGPAHKMMKRFWALESEPKVPVSERVEKLNDHGKWFNWQKGHTFDVLGLMHGLFPLQRVELAQHFPEMCGKSYLAVIHADGNAVGKRFNEWTESKGEKDPVRKEVIGEKFYYTMRVVVRKAVLAALRDTFPETLEVDFRPYQLLMLGGDDLVMVCKAEHALEFAYHYARHVERSGTNLPDESPLTVGIGIAIASANFPFYHLHTLAEQLASSAKRLYRSLPANARTSVVDWMVCTNSWSDDPQQQRKKAELISYHVPSANSTARNEQLALIRRPYTVLPGPEGSPNDLQSLEGLRLAAQSLSSSLKEADDRPARSQLRSLAMELYRGRLSGKLAFDELPQGTKKALEDVGIKKPWEEVTPDSNHWTTSLVDLVDLIEIPLLGKARDATEEQP